MGCGFESHATHHCDQLERCLRAEISFGLAQLVAVSASTFRYAARLASLLKVYQRPRYS